MDTFEPNLPVFDRLRTILTSRMAGREDYSHQQVLDAVEACSSEYDRLFHEQGGHLSDDEIERLRQEMDSLDEMIEAERARVQRLLTSSPEPSSSSSLPPGAAASSDAAVDANNDTDMDDLDTHTNADSEGSEMQDPDERVIEALADAFLREFLSMPDEDEDEDEDEGDARYVTLAQRPLTEHDRNDDGSLECPISREDLDVGQMGVATHLRQQAE